MSKRTMNSLFTGKPQRSEAGKIYIPSGSVGGTRVKHGGTNTDRDGDGIYFEKGGGVHGSGRSHKNPHHRPGRRRVDKHQIRTVRGY